MKLCTCGQLLFESFFSEMENIFDCSDCLSCIKSAAAKEREDNSKRVLDDKEESKTELKRKELAK